MDVYLQCLGQEPWKRVVAVCESAAIFLDNSAAELFHWCEKDNVLQRCVGVYSLYHELNPVARDFIFQAPYSRVVIIVTTPLIGRCAERIASLLSDLQPLECHVFCSKSEAIHNEHIPMAGEEEYSHYGEFQALMKKWINRETGLRVSVSHLNLFHVEILPNLFVTPVHKSLQSLLPSDIPLIQKCLEEIEPDTSFDSLEELHFQWLPKPYQIKIKSFVQSFNSFLGSLDVQEDIFSLGSTSRIVANQLCFLEEGRTRRKSASKKCSLLFVDRSLDLASPCVHSMDYLTDKLLSLLPPLNTDSNDVAINMSTLSEIDPRCMVSGCLAQPGDNEANSILYSLTFSKQKEALMDLSRHLLEALSKEKISSRPPGRLARPSSAQVKGFVDQFKNNTTAIIRHSGMLQLACGVVEVMNHPESKRWEKLNKDEQTLMLNLSNDASSISVVKYIHKIVNSQVEKSDGVHTVELVDILSLIIEFYSLVGEDCFTHHMEETHLKGLLTDLIMKKRKCDISFLNNSGFRSDWTRLQVMERVDEIFTCFNSLGNIRNHFTDLADIYISDADNCLNPTIVQLMECIVDPARPDIPDVKYHSHGLTDMIRSSFSLFMSSAKPRPDSHPILILYIIGGLSMGEIRAVKEATNHSNLEVILGTTELLTPQKTVLDLLCRTEALNSDQI